MRVKNLFSILSCTFFLILCQNSHACSSCGSSATSPLVLYPDENLKIYFGLSQNFNYINYGLAGNKTLKWVNPNITTKDTATFAVGYRTSENSFVTLTSSYVRNEGPASPGNPRTPSNPSAGTKEVYLLGDPILSGRYNLSNMEISAPYTPQIQLVASYKPTIAKNMVDNDGGELDTTGNGFHQFSGGVDFWWGMSFIQFGGAQFITYSLTRHPDVNVDGVTETNRSRDLQYTTILTIGHAFTEQHFQLQSGIVLDYVGREHEDYSNGTSYLSPAQQSNSIFVTLNWNVTNLDLIRFSYSYGGAIESNLGPYTNSSQSTSSMALVAYERTFF